MKYFSNQTGLWYDSKSEGNYHERNPTFRKIGEHEYLFDRFMFRDSNGWGSLAKADFKDEQYGVYIEFKCAPLNFSNSMKEAEFECEKATRYMWKSPRFSQAQKQAAQRTADLKYAWNHALEKQGLTADEAKNRGEHFCVVFDNKTMLTHDKRKGEAGILAEQERYNERGVIWMYENEYPTYAKSLCLTVPSGDFVTSCPDAWHTGANNNVTIQGACTS